MARNIRVLLEANLYELAILRNLLEPQPTLQNLLAQMPPVCRCAPCQRELIELSHQAMQPTNLLPDA